MTSNALDLFGSFSSTSEDETAGPALVLHRKCPQRSPLKISRKSSDVPPTKGASIENLFF
jgi:hypothetical protein